MRTRLLLLLRGLIALALIAAPAWTVISTGDTVRHQHVSVAILLAVSLLCGLVLLGFTGRAVARRRTLGSGAASGGEHGNRPDPGSASAGEHGDHIGTIPAAATHAPRSTGPRRVLRGIGATVGLVLLVVLAGASAWLRPFPADDAARAALVSDSAVTVTESGGWYTFTPTDPATTGLVYSPGARVDVRATAAVLRPLAEAGYLVVVLKEPLGIALTDLGQSAGPIDAHPEIEHWAVGGHSLGGVAAARFAEQHPELVDGLLLHASYPLDDMSAATDLTITSISGSQDGLSTPAKIDASRAKLPADTTYVQVPGAVHAFFADYGAQPGDGRPTTSRADAQEQIITASRELLERINLGG